MPTLDQVNTFLDTTKDAREYKRAMAVKLLLLDFEPHDIAALLHVICYRTENPFASGGAGGGSAGKRKRIGMRFPSRRA